MYTALIPIPTLTFAEEPLQNIGKSFIKSYGAVLIVDAVKMSDRIIREMMVL